MPRAEIPQFRSATAIRDMVEAHIQHPFNGNSDIYLKRLSPETGLQRLALYVARVPPGKESFAYHRHERDEEFVYVLSGRGIAQIGEDEIEIGPGDFMGFPAPDGPAHHLKNPFDKDLVYLMGGESSGLDIGYFPRIGKRIIFNKSGPTALDDQDCRQMSFDQWLVDPE